MCADFLSHWLSSRLYAGFHLGLSPIGRVKKKKTHLSPQLDQIASSIKSIGATILLSSHINSTPPPFHFVLYRLYRQVSPSKRWCGYSWLIDFIYHSEKRRDLTGHMPWTLMRPILEKMIQIQQFFGLSLFGSRFRHELLMAHRGWITSAESVFQGEDCELSDGWYVTRGLNSSVGVAGVGTFPSF